MYSTTFIAIIITFSALLLATIILMLGKFRLLNRQLEQLTAGGSKTDDISRQLLEKHHEQRTQFDQHCIKTNQGLQNSITEQMRDVREQIQTALKQHQGAFGTQFEQLTNTVYRKLKDIGTQVDKTLASGFEKTTATFQDVVKRLTIIDQAQKKISELSNHVVDLQEILVDNRSRGAFGEVQLSALIHNMLPENHFSMQHTLSNGKRVDCLLMLPAPTGNIAIDAKFPLATFRQLTQSDLSTTDKTSLSQQFRRDIKIHIQDIASKYLISGETADGAIMFIPAEAVFAEIHANFPDLVEHAHENRVWLTSPTTMMAILTTTRAVLKDEATRQQVHIIQKHLSLLGKDFNRFQKRMDQLSRHINQAQEDVSQIHTSSQKITRRFEQIESVELDNNESLLLEDDTTC